MHELIEITEGSTKNLLSDRYRKYKCKCGNWTLEIAYLDNYIRNLKYPTIKDAIVSFLKTVDSQFNEHLNKVKLNAT